jgi:uncharacterized protein (TIGR03032 family)
MSRLHEKQQAMLRDPSQITGLWNGEGLDPRTFQSHADEGWKRTLRKLGVTLLVTREYEHLVLALSSRSTTWMHLPHPSGLVADRKTRTVHVACTRNPNLLVELAGDKLLPRRARFLPGRTYLHDLALIGGKLYGNSVGQNAVVELDYQAGAKRIWWPRCVVRQGKPVFGKNHLQLNSIAAGPTLKSSFFSASVDRILPQVPGDKDFPVDGRGVIFSGSSRESVAFGLTRPHSARLHRGQVWVDNSGYGEVGRIVHGTFQPLVKLPGWTRGLCFVKGILFVGLSKVLPRFHAYAPGLDHKKSLCALVALDPVQGKVLGRLSFPHGNQIFAIDWMEGVELPYGQGRDPRGLFYDMGERA